MGRETKIEWCDSTVNLMMGCDGCELSARGGSGTCYAEVLTDRYGGKAGWPRTFYEPALFHERLAQALRWPDLTGTGRPEKPWLNGLPRHIFLDDMGDTFTESLPLDWLAPHIPAMEASPHVWQFLTKRPRRMRHFIEQLGRVPENFHLGTSVTNRASARRVEELLKITDASLLWVSYEPAIEAVDFEPYLHDSHCLDAEIPDCLCCEPREAHVGWIVIGGESGPGARPFDVEWARRVLGECRAIGARAFVKQMGGHVTWDGTSGPGEHWPEHRAKFTDTGRGNWRVQLSDPKGGSPSEWPEDLRVREMPAAEQGQGELALGVGRG